MRETSPTIEKASTVSDAAPTYDEAALVHAAKEGDVPAFEVLIKRYDKKIFRIAHHITDNREDAEDAVQETFLNAFQNLAQFRGDSQFSTWLTRISVNEALGRLRKRRAVREVSIDEDFEAESDIAPLEIADWAPNPEELYGRSELRDILRRGLQALRPRLAAVFVLRDIEGFSTEQTGEILGITDVAVKARLFRARLKLRESLAKYFRHPESRSADARGAPDRPQSGAFQV
jgi:RNA polymerase sigma-70 factor (ECF subfamily)